MIDWGYTEKIFPSLLSGMGFTIWFFIVVFTLSLILSVFLAIVTTYKIKVLNAGITIFTSTVRGTPLLFQLYFVYFGLPIIFGIKIDAYQSALLAFTSSWVAYLTENIRGAITGIDKGQIEAAYVLGLNKFQTMFYIVLPQALASALPSITNEAVNLVYGTALLSTLGLDDLLKNARVAVIRDLRLESFLIAAILYALFNGLVILIFKKIQIRMNLYKQK